MDDTSKKIDELRNKIGKSGKKGWKSYLKKSLLITTPLIVAGGIFAGYLGRDFFLKRQNYPERHVLFRSSEVVNLSGGSENIGIESADKESITKVYEGGLVSKVGTFLFETSREERDDIKYFNMDNSQHIRVASAVQKPETLQAGLRIGGSINFREEIAEIVTGTDSKKPKKYTVYKFIPERGLEEKEITVIHKPNGEKRFHNRLKDVRSLGLGWYFGKTFRAGTFLEEYVSDSDDNAEEFVRNIDILDSQKIGDKSDREAVINNAIDAEEKIERKPIYYSYEDGIFDILPQESTTYFGSNPGWKERAKHFWGFDRDERNRLRVENNWDLWPGNYFLLNKISFGSGKNSLRPFSKYNNGGYTLTDKFGEIAKIKITDFVLYYGQDVLYSYFLDLNGDGEIEDDELIGEVLCRTTHDDRINLDQIVGEGKPKTDVTITMNYSFMAPDSDIDKGMKYFNLCGFIESCMPNEVHRGFGKHSFLGFINRQRSDTMLYRDLTIENMSRALTQESALVAKYDIVEVLIASRRPYAKDLAKSYGIVKEFEGKFNPSEDLEEKFEIGPIPGTLITLGLMFGGINYWRKRKKKKKEKQKEKSLLENGKEKK